MTNINTTAKFNKSEIFKAAWSFVKTAGKSLSEALKAAWAAAKAPVEEVIEFIAERKAMSPCTYKQYDYLTSFENFTYNCKSGSQFMKRVDVWAASEMIGLLKSGKKVNLMFY